MMVIHRCERCPVRRDKLCHAAEARLYDACRRIAEGDALVATLVIEASGGPTMARDRAPKPAIGAALPARDCGCGGNAGLT